MWGKTQTNENSTTNREKGDSKMKRITTCLLLLSFIGVLTPPLESSSAQIDQIVATARINLLNGPQSNSSNQPNSSVSAAAQSSGGASSSQANTSASLTARASSLEVGLSHPSVGNAFFRSVFRNYRSSLGTYIPPGTSFDLSGTLLASSEPGNAGSVALACYFYNLGTTSGGRSGTVCLGSQGGIPRLVQVKGERPGNLRARIQPKIGLSGGIPLVQKNFIKLEIDFNRWEIPLSEFEATNFGAVAALVSQAINKSGLDRLNLAPGLKLSVGFDVDFKIDFTTQLAANLHPGMDVMSANIECTASTSQGAWAKSVFELSPAGR